MSVPAGFFELSPLPGALGPSAATRPKGIEDASFPILARMRLYWGKPNEPAPATAQGYPASVLYGGPVPREWGMNTLPGWVRDWAATLAPPAGAASDGSRWLVLLGPPAFLVPPEALAFPYSDFRWVWTLEQGPGDLYQIEGVPNLLQFRNLRTGQWDRPGAFGNMPTAVAGDELGGCTCLPTASTKVTNPQLLEDTDEVDPRCVTWLTEDEWRLHGRVLWPVWITNEYSVGLGGSRKQCPVGFDAGARNWVECGLEAGHEGPHITQGEPWWTDEPWDSARVAELEQLWTEHKLGKGNQIQCAAITRQFDGVSTECGMGAGHPGPHINGPPRLGRVWVGELDQVELGASAKQPVDWYRIHYVDVVTGSDAYSPWPLRYTLAQAKAWVRKRTTWGSTVIPILQKFISGKGWRSA